MDDKLKNTNNPFARGDTFEIAKRIIASLMPDPKDDTRTDAEKRAFEEDRKHRQEAYQELRFGNLPENTYRILEQGSFIGWYYELELNGKIIPIKDAENNEFGLFGDSNKAIDIARKHIADELGRSKADIAHFRFLFGGQM